MTKPRVLIVEDEPAIRDTIQFALETEGIDTIQLGTAAGVLPMLAAGPGQIDLIVLDVGLPDMSGFDLLKEVRKTHRTPVILLTARNAELDRVLGLEIGADDYVVKPFSPRELSARVKAVLRRTQPVESGTLVAATTTTTATGLSAPRAVEPASSLVVHPAKRQVTYHGVLLTLSKYEYEILTTFIERPGHVFSRDQLMNRIWEVPESSLERTVDAHIKNLRAKLRAVQPDIEPIVTHRGTGYSLREDL